MTTFWESVLLNVFRICVIIVATIIALWWLTVPPEDFEELEDPFSVTITYNCREVLADPEDDGVPQHIVNECNKLARELQNATKSNKPIV